VLTLAGDRICAMTRFEASVLPWFGLPAGGQDLEHSADRPLTSNALCSYVLAGGRPVLCGGSARPACEGKTWAGDTSIPPHRHLRTGRRLALQSAQTEA
jgi:hypothetical protein